MLSVVIISKNEEQYIGEVIKSVLDVSNDIIIVDSGSTDNTLNICRQYSVNILETNWEGYGQNKNKGIALTKNEWILSLDADECIDNQLKESIRNLNLNEKNIVYQINWKNFFLNKHIQYGVWGKDKHIRIFNKNFAFWNNVDVHEELILPDNAEIIFLRGYVNHYTVKSQKAYKDKLKNYAKLCADKYFNKKKKATFIKLYLSPLFSFIKNYFFKLGFLDGYYGFIVCKFHSQYTYLKYKYLKEKYSNQ